MASRSEAAAARTARSVSLMLSSSGKFGAAATSVMPQVKRRSESGFMATT